MAEDRVREVWDCSIDRRDGGNSACTGRTHYGMMGHLINASKISVYYGTLSELI